MMQDVGPAKPMFQPIENAYNTGKQFLQHPLDTARGLFFPPQHQQQHDQAIQQVNQQLNSHKNDAANQSFIHNQMAKPMGALRSKMGGQ